MVCLTRFIVPLCAIAVSISHASIIMPAGITSCSRNDPNLNDCALKSAQDALPLLIEGNSTLGMPPMDPLHVNELKIDDMEASRNFPLKVTLKHINVIGLKDIKFKSFNIDLDTGKVKWTGVVPRLEMTGNYSGHGRISFMPVKGKGGLNITMEKVVISHSFKLSRLQSKRGLTRGQIMMKTSNSILTTKMDRAFIDIQNLFNGDKRFENHMNKFLSDNWQILHEELGSSLNEVFSTSFNHLIGRVTSIVPYSELFPEINE